MKIIPISVLDDNYSYILIDDKTKEAAVIDPVEPIKILNVISQTGAKLSRWVKKKSWENPCKPFLNTLKLKACSLHITIGIMQVVT